MLWRFIVSNKLLKETSLVLFLNKCDVLKAKLDAGVHLGKYVISYGDRPNDFSHVSECELFSAMFVPLVSNAIRRSQEKICRNLF